MLGSSTAEIADRHHVLLYIYIDSTAEDRRSSSCALIYIYIDSTAEDRRSSSCALIYIYI